MTKHDILWHIIPWAKLIEMRFAIQCVGVCTYACTHTYALYIYICVWVCVCVIADIEKDIAWEELYRNWIYKYNVVPSPGHVTHAIYMFRRPREISSVWVGYSCFAKIISFPVHNISWIFMGVLGNLQEATRLPCEEKMDSMDSIQHEYNIYIYRYVYIHVYMISIYVYIYAYIYICV